MSDGKRFSKVEIKDLSPEERLASLEARLPVLIERIQAYDKVVDDYKELKSKALDIEAVCQDIKNSILWMTKAIYKVEEKNQDLSKNLSLSFESLQQKIAAISLKESSYEDRINRDLQDKEANILSLKKELGNLNSTVMHREDFLAFINAVKADINHSRDEEKATAQRIKDIYEKIKDIDSNRSFIVHSIKEIDSKVASINTDFSAFPKELKDLETNVSFDVNKRFMVLYDKMNSRLDSMSVKLIPQGVSLAEIKQDFLGKLDSFKLDVSNAILKGSNNTQQISILEKRLENVQLLIKKYVIENNPLDVANLDSDVVKPRERATQ